MNHEEIWKFLLISYCYFVPWIRGSKYFFHPTILARSNALKMLATAY